MARSPQVETTVLIADPPWPHANGSRTNSGKSPKYPLMLLSEICALGPVVRKLAGDDAVLYLWVTSPCLLKSAEVLESWGFTYRSYHAWVKDRAACGFWNRSDAEVCIVAERGRPSSPAGALPRTVFRAPRLRGVHSSKPSVIHEVVERLWKDSRKVELFARSVRPGWACYGSDLGLPVGS